MLRNTSLMPFLLICSIKIKLLMMMQDLNNTLQQNKSGTCPAHQPNDSTQAGNQSVVECNKEDTAKSHSDSIELQPLIPDKDYPAGVREWMMTAPSELKFSTLRWRVLCLPYMPLVSASIMFTIIRFLPFFFMCWYVVIRAQENRLPVI